MENVNKQLLDAVKHCHGIFDQYVGHHLAKPDYDKAAANERHRAICAEAIAAAEQAQQAEESQLLRQARQLVKDIEAKQQAEPVALSLPFFAYDSETGFERFATEVEAKAAAQESIEAYREDAGEEWAEEVENICWGVVLGTTREVPLPDEYSGSNGLADSMKPVDYVLTDAAQPPAVAVPLSAALADIAAERRRQVGQEGWTPEHDDKYRPYVLSGAAGCYAMHTLAYPAGDPPPAWPFAASWWKPSADTRRNLVKAGALIAAEIERLDRAAQKGE